MTNKTIPLIIIMTMALLLAACEVEANDVPSLQDAQSAADEASVADPVVDNEALMMAFTECLREQGLDVADPMVDADGNIGKPELVDGGSLDKEALGAAMEICGERLEGFTFGKKRGDVSGTVDQFLTLAACLRDKGYNVADPTAETLDQWMADFKNGIDWDDPTAVSDYETCSGETVGAGGKK